MNAAWHFWLSDPSTTPHHTHTSHSDVDRVQRGWVAVGGGATVAKLDPPPLPPAPPSVCASEIGSKDTPNETRGVKLRKRQKLPLRDIDVALLKERFALIAGIKRGPIRRLRHCSPPPTAASNFS